MSTGRPARVFLAAMLWIACLAAPALSGENYPWVTIDRFETRALFEARRFDELADRMETARKDGLADPRRELVLFAMLSAVGIPEHPEDKLLLDAWVEKMPGHWAPWLARAKYSVNAAWRARGTKWASETTDAQFDKMADFDDRVMADLKQALRIEPALVAAYQIMQDLAMRYGKQDASRRIIVEALRISPASYSARKVHLSVLEPRWGGSYEAMEAFIREAKPFYGRNPSLRWLEGSPDWDRGRMSMSRSRKDADPAVGRAEAIEYFRKALAHGGSIGVLDSLGDAYLRSARYPDALEVGDRIISEVRNSMEGHFLRASALAGLGRHDEALKALAEGERQKWLKHDFRGEAASPDMVTERAGIAGRYFSEADALFTTDVSKAVERYTLGLRYQPRHAKALRRRAEGYLRLGDSNGALADLETAIELDPRFYSAYKTMDDLLVKQGRLDEIIANWGRYLDLVPGDDNAYLERSGTYFRKRDFESSYRDAKRACKLGNQQACGAAGQLKGRCGDVAAGRVDAEIDGWDAGKETPGRGPARSKGLDGKWIFRGANGEPLPGGSYDDAWDFKDGLARVKRDGLWGYIDGNGTLVIPLLYGYCWDFEKDRAKVRLVDGLVSYIDRTGKALDD